MFPQIFRKLGCIKSILRLPEQTLLSRTLCGINQGSRSVLEKKEHSSNNIYAQTGYRSLCNLGPLGTGVMKTDEHNSILQSAGPNLLQSSQTAPLNNLISVRTKCRRYYRPSAIKRINKHGLEKRISTRPQKEVLFRRILKGRGMLTTFDRFKNEIPECRIKKSKRVNLFDKKTGYPTVLKKKKRFYFTEI